MKTGLILEGGAMRGMFTAGVMDVLMEAGVEFDGAIGVSAGACFGCNYKSRQIGRVLRYNTTYARDKRYGGLRVLIREGNLFSTDFCYDVLPNQLDPFDYETYERNPMEFWVVCTDIETGKPVYHRYEGKRDHGLDWIRASASMPLVSRVVEIDGQKFLDGGMSDSIPLEFFQSMGYERNVLILTQPEDYRKGPEKLLPMMKAYYRRYPELIATMSRRHTDYNACLERIAAQEAKGGILVIRPKEKLLIAKAEKDPVKLRAVYDLGREAAIEALDRVRAFLGEAKA